MFLFALRLQLLRTELSEKGTKGKVGPENCNDLSQMQVGCDRGFDQLMIEAHSITGNPCPSVFITRHDNPLTAADVIFAIKFSDSLILRFAKYPLVLPIGILINCDRVLHGQHWFN
ncbi:hypothetical protein CBL_08912 [Carabus blaptoides fortunei]